MPDGPRDYGLDNLALVFRLLMAAGAICWIGALVAYATDADADAGIVLVVLGVVALITGGMVWGELTARRRTPEPQRNDFEDS